MKTSSKWFSVLAIALLVVTALASMGAAPADHQGKGPIDKTVFVHYPKNAPGKPEAAPGKGPGGTGVLNADYKYSGVHWANPSAINYYINPTGSGVVDVATVSALNAAFVTWDGADGPLGYVYGGISDRNGGVFDAYNVVSWADISSQYPSAIAVTSVWSYRYNKEIVEVDTQMNSAFSWSYTEPNITSPELSGKATKDAARYADPTNFGPAGTFDIRSIMTHEAGHWIMLGDLYKSSDSYLTMYGYGSTQELTKDTIAYGDELGVERVYPY